MVIFKQSNKKSNKWNKSQEIMFKINLWCKIIILVIILIFIIITLTILIFLYQTMINLENFEIKHFNNYNIYQIIYFNISYPIYKNKIYMRFYETKYI